MERPLVSRQVNDGFDPRAYYTIHNYDMIANKSLSSGHNKDANGSVNMTQEGTFSSSENWQFYFQQGRYFIRNYDYGSGWQLGLDQSSQSIPQLMRTSGALGQQWTLLKQDGGGWRLTNGLLGNDSALSLSLTNTVPAFNPNSGDKGSRWEILNNPSAGSPQDAAMLIDVAGFEVSVMHLKSSAFVGDWFPQDAKPVTTSSIAPSSTVQSEVSQRTSTSSTQGATIPTSESQRLGAGPIAGIVVGAVVLVVAVGVLAYFLLYKRKQNKKKTSAAELGSDPTQQSKYIEHVDRAEIGAYSAQQHREDMKHNDIIEIG
jgi:hypothetical protein